jgi:dihydrofolate synthase/folylpolyglutamate synthase
MTYDEAIHFWFSRVNYERVSPDPNDLKLDRMRVLLALLDNPQDRLRIIHVAGSKGKGSTSAMLASILQKAGYRTGLFTSPHLCRIEERVQVNGQPIQPHELTMLVEQIDSATRRYQASPHGNSSALPELELTFFEVATALGFLYFALRQVDFAVVEVGLGGRFDSTNVCQPLISVITSISYDHTQQLGNELASIAMEKAGIIKPGRPVVSGARQSEARAVIETIARRQGAPLRQLGEGLHYHYRPGRVGSCGESNDDAFLDKPRVRVTTESKTWPDMEIGLLGEHQAANASIAVACIEELHALGISIDMPAVQEGLSNVQWPARMEVLGRRPLIALDCAHNVASTEALVQTLLSSFPQTCRHLIFASSADKDLSGMLAVLAPCFDRVYLTRYTSSSRGASLADLTAIATKAGMIASCWQTPAEAWTEARAAAKPDELICVTGSVFLAGELRPRLLQDACRHA